MLDKNDLKLIKETIDESLEEKLEEKLEQKLRPIKEEKFLMREEFNGRIESVNQSIHSLKTDLLTNNR